MKEFHVLFAAMLLIFVALMVSGVRGTLEEAEPANGNSVLEGADVKEHKYVALTFDDGPKAGKTDRVLDMLKAKEVPATFFMIGAQVEENMELVKRVAAEGHQIGIHTYNHVDMSCLTAEEQKEEIEKTKDAIEAVVGEREFVLRPPFGAINSELENWLDMPIILWDVDTLDWKDRKAADIVVETVEGIRNGDIILMHDIGKYSVAAAAGIIDELKRMGYTFLTIDQLFTSREIALEDGESYYWAR